MVVAGHQQYAAMLCGAGMVHVLEHIGAAVDTGALRVPHREHAIVFGRANEIDRLRTPDGGRGKVFVHAGHEFHVVAIQMLVRLP